MNKIFGKFRNNGIVVYLYIYILLMKMKENNTAQFRIIQNLLRGGGGGISKSKSKQSNFVGIVIA